MIPSLPFNLSILFLWLASIVYSGSASATQNGVEFDEFASLNHDDQATIVRIAMEERMVFAKNIFYESTRITRIQKFDGEVPGKVTHGDNMPKFVHRHWKLGDSYRMDTDAYWSAAHSNPAQLVQNQFDANQGVTRGRVNGFGDERIFARIDTKQDSYNSENRYAFWLFGEDVFDAEFLIRYMVQHADQYEIEIENDTKLIKLTVPWMPLHSRSEVLGKRTVWLDSTKKFLPISGKARWDDDKNAGMWRTEEFVVLDSQLVGNVWMPMKIRELIQTNLADEGIFCVNVTTVQKIEQGTVTEGDLWVEFPPGTKVIHAIEGVTYKIGPNGQRIDTEPLVIGNTFIKAEPEAVTSGSSVSYLFITANLIALLVAVGLYVRLRRRAAHQAA